MELLETSHLASLNRSIDDVNQQRAPTREDALHGDAKADRQGDAPTKTNERNPKEHDYRQGSGRPLVTSNRATFARGVVLTAPLTRESRIVAKLLIGGRVEAHRISSTAKIKPKS